MEVKNYPIFKVHVDVDGALENLKTVLASGFLNEGECVTQFTEFLNNYLNHKNVVLLNSCTSALTLALKLAGVSSDDEVITTSMTCVATVTPISNLGAKVVWCDIDYKTGNIDPLKIESLITQKTKAILCVNWAGIPCDLEMLQEICKKNGIKLIQDAAHSFGAKYNGESVCHYADYTCFSFQAIKHITTGDGGALICKSEQDFERAKKLKWFGIDRDATKNEKGEWKGQRWEVNILEAGYKFHMNNISAAIGLSQIPHIDNIIQSHIDNANMYDNLFKDNPHIKPLKFNKNTQPTHWVYTVILDESINRNDVLEKMNKQGIAAGLVHIPCDGYHCFADSKTDLPHTKYFYEHQLSLPCGWWLNSEDINFITTTLIKNLHNE
jgi:dTDP-4-amino-4,6-dideoxygalactose transaminase